LLDERLNMIILFFISGRFDDKEVIRIHVPGGTNVEFILAGNIMWPTHFFTTGFAPDVRENLKNIECMGCRDNDVILCAYPRSGKIVFLTLSLPYRYENKI